MFLFKLLFRHSDDMACLTVTDATTMNYIAVQCAFTYRQYTIRDIFLFSPAQTLWQLLKLTFWYTCKQYACVSKNTGKKASKIGKGIFKTYKLLLLLYCVCVLTNFLVHGCRWEFRNASKVFLGHILQRKVG